MTHSIIVWSGILLIIVLAFIFRVMEKCQHAKNLIKRHIHLIEMDKEEKMLFCPDDENLEIKNEFEN